MFACIGVSRWKFMVGGRSLHLLVLWVIAIAAVVLRVVSPRDATSSTQVELSETALGYAKLSELFQEVCFACAAALLQLLRSAGGDIPECKASSQRYFFAPRGLAEVLDCDSRPCPCPTWCRAHTVE